MVAMKASGFVTLVEITVGGEQWRYCDSERDIERDGKRWTGIGKGNATFVSEDADWRPPFLSAIKSAKPKRIPGGPLPRSIRGHKKLKLTNLRGRIPPLEQTSMGKATLWRQLCVPYGTGKWFSCETHEGPIVEATVYPATRRLDVVSIDLFLCGRWTLVGRTPSEIVDHIATLPQARIDTRLASDGYYLLEVDDEDGSEWVVGKSSDRDEITQLNRAVSRELVARRHGTPARLYKYIDREFADDFVKGLVRISPDVEFKEEGAGLSDGQMDDEREKVTTLGVSDLIGETHSPDAEYAFDRETSELTMKVGFPYWMLCTSMLLEKDEHLLRDEFGKAIVEIEDPTEFGNRLATAVANALGVEPYAAGPVDYERHKDFLYFGYCKTTYPHPALFKNRSFEYQREYRFVWAGEGPTPREPIVVDMGTNEHCARVVSYG